MSESVEVLGIVDNKYIWSDLTALNVCSPGFSTSIGFNTFLYGVIQNDGTTYSWNSIIDITFNSLGSGQRPNNALTIKVNQSYNSKTLTDLFPPSADEINLGKSR